jgi:hypothetical protein
MYARNDTGQVPTARLAGRAVPVRWFISPLKSSTSPLAEVLCPAPEGLVPSKTRCLWAVGPPFCFSAPALSATGPN